MINSLFSGIEVKTSAHPIKRIFEADSNGKKKIPTVDPIVYKDIFKLGTKEKQALVENLREVYLRGLNDMEIAQDEKKSTVQNLQTLQNELKSATEEKNRFKTLYKSEIRNKNDLRKYISSQKSLKRASKFP